jgi:ADP-heptose:LPS heptosyltransferase
MVSPDERGTVLALRALKLGDLLVAVPALRALRRGFPGHRLVLATTGWLAPVVDLTGCVDELLPVSGLEPLRGMAHPVVAVNLHGAGPESNRVLDALNPARHIGHQGHGWIGPKWTDDLHERARWCRLLTAHGIRADADDLYLRAPLVPSPAPGAIVLHPGAAYGSRQWPVDRFAAVARGLKELGHRVVITGTNAEHPRAAEVATAAGVPWADVFTGKLGLSGLAALTAAARLVVSADTGIAHLSYAYRTPSVVLFGPAPRAQWGPPRNGPHIVLTDESVRDGDAFAHDPDPALLAVTAEQALTAAAGLAGR